MKKLVLYYDKSEATSWFTRNSIIKHVNIITQDDNGHVIALERDGTGLFVKYLKRSIEHYYEHCFSIDHCVAAHLFERRPVQSSNCSIVYNNCIRLVLDVAGIRKPWSVWTPTQLLNYLLDGNVIGIQHLGIKAKSFVMDDIVPLKDAGVV